MTDAHVSPDYCAHGVGIDLPCEDCARWYASVHRGQNMDDVEPPTFDAGRSPTDETLARIAAWPCKTANDVRACLDFATCVWNYEYGSVGMVKAPQELAMLHAQKGERFVRFVTGGWSDNESVIGALEQNIMLHASAWCLSTRGGLHIFRY